MVLIEMDPFDFSGGSFPIVLFVLLIGAVAGLVWLFRERQRTLAELRQLTADKRELKIEVEDLRDGKGKLERDLSAAQAELATLREEMRGARQDLERARVTHEELGRAHETLQAEHARVSRRSSEIEDKLRTVAARDAAREEEVTRERKVLETHLKETMRDGRQLGEAKAEMLGRSRAITSQMNRLSRELKSWVKAIEMLSGVAEEENDERTLRFRSMVQSACDEFLDAREAGANRAVPRLVDRAG